MALPTIEVLCQQARQAIAERNWDKARQAYVQALALKADSPDIHQGLATVCFQLRDLPSAAQHFKEVTRLDPHRAGAFINLGAIYNLLDRYDDAINMLRKAIQIDPQRAEGFYNLGLVYRRKGQTDLAIHAYREALRVNPRLADASYNLANLFLEKEQFKQAIEFYRQALASRPEWEKALQGLAQADEALAAQAAEDALSGPAEDAAPEEQDPTLSRVKLDPTLMLDPEVHGVLLSSLHKAAVDAENNGKKFFDMADSELEPAIKELSTALISPDITLTALDTAIQRFEDAMRSIRGLKDTLSTSVAKVRMIGDELIEQAS
jgi:tetratricopeptide (TPR) repeat protein